MNLYLVDVEADKRDRVRDGGGGDPPDVVVGEVERLHRQLGAEVVEVPHLGDPVGAQVQPSGEWQDGQGVKINEECIQFNTGLFLSSETIFC